VIDANGQSLAYVYSRETKDAADIAKVLTEDEARRIASDIVRPERLIVRHAFPRLTLPTFQGYGVECQGGEPKKLRLIVANGGCSETGSPS
jgi:hypothetical protein